MFRLGCEKRRRNPRRGTPRRFVYFSRTKDTRIWKNVAASPVGSDTAPNARLHRHRYRIRRRSGIGQGRSRTDPALGEALCNCQFDFLVSGIVSMPRRWLAEGRREPVELMADVADNYMSALDVSVLEHALELAEQERVREG